jgi:transposase
LETQTEALFVVWQEQQTMNRIPVNLQELYIGGIDMTSNGVTTRAHSTVLAVSCPACGVITRSIHSYYWRQVKDLPISGQ